LSSEIEEKVEKTREIRSTMKKRNCGHRDKLPRKTLLIFGVT